MKLENEKHSQKKRRYRNLFLLGAGGLTLGSLAAYLLFLGLKPEPVPEPRDIPTLASVGLLVLASALAAVAIWIIRLKG